MLYFINVSTEEGHLFETTKNNKTYIERVYKVFQGKFPKNEGYEILVFDEIGRFIDMDYLNNTDNN